MPADPLHERLLAMVLKLPGAYEDRPWGSVHCKVAGKIFVGWHRDDDGKLSIGFKTDKALQAMLLASDPRFAMAAYVGKHGWVDLRPGGRPNWAEIEQFIETSYRMIAPKKLVKELDAGATAKVGRGSPLGRARTASSRPRAKPPRS